jgi:hypothetical protein
MSSLFSKFSNKKEPVSAFAPPTEAAPPLPSRRSRRTVLILTQEVEREPKREPKRGPERELELQAINPVTQAPPEAEPTGSTELRFRTPEISIPKFEKMMHQFVIEHYLTHEKINQRHFQEIIKILKDVEKSPEQKLLDIAVQLQWAQEYIFSKLKKRCGLERKPQTKASYERLYNKLYRDFSHDFIGSESLGDKVRRCLGRDPDSRFTIEFPVRGAGAASSRPLAALREAALFLHAAGAGAGTVSDTSVETSTPADAEEGEFFPSFALPFAAPSRPTPPVLRQRLPDEAIENAKAALYQHVYFYFVNDGKMNTDTLERIFNTLIRESDASAAFLASSFPKKTLAPFCSKTVMKIQIFLMESFDEMNPFRNSQTQELYNQLQQALFRTAFTHPEVTAKYTPYRAQILREREERLRQAAEAMAIAHVYFP